MRSFSRHISALAVLFAALSLPTSPGAQELASLTGMEPSEALCTDLEGFGAAALTDGDLTTLWRTERQIAPCQFVFRFDDPVAVSAITVHNRYGKGAGTPSRRATVWASHQAEGRGFFRVAHQQLNDEGATRISFDEPTLMRTLKIAIENPDPFSGDPLYASLAELEIESVDPATASRWPMPRLEPLTRGDPIEAHTATRCDTLAAMRYNPDSYGFGLPAWRIDVPAALNACRSAVAAAPQSMRLAFQLARVEGLAEQSVRSIARLGSALLENYPPAMHLLADALTAGTGIAQDEERARALHQAAADVGFLPSRMRLAGLDNSAYVDSLVSGEQQPLGAEEPLNAHLAILMEAGYSPAYGLYNDYILRTDSSALLSFMPRLEELAEYNYGGPFAQHLYNQNHGIPEARRRAHRWIWESARLFDDPSTLGNLSLSYRFVYSDHLAAVPAAREGAYSGDEWPVRQLAERSTGAATQRLLVFSFQRALLAANDGNVGAMFAVGDALIAGRGVEENRAEGARWLRLAAATGEPRAIAYLQANSWAQTAGETDQ